jgi:predicted DNA-binding transcriptional regulator
MADYGPRLPDPRMIPPWAPPLPPGRPEPAPDPEGDRPAGTDADDNLFIRPFFVTGGRTRPLHDGLRIETIVSARPAALSAPLRFELRRIVELCQRPLSVAEIAVRLGVPLGVARVLVADLVTDGYVSFSQPAELPINVLERIRDRVRAL